jgi:hypothetical protein
MLQFLAAQMQLFQDMSNRMATMQGQMNHMNQNQPPKDNHQKFMRHDPLTFSHVVDPLEADDWLKSIEKILTITQCTDTEKVLYASVRLQGSTANWWDSYRTSLVDPSTITWSEFKTSFSAYRISRRGSFSVLNKMGCLWTIKISSSSCPVMRQKRYLLMRRSNITF